MITYTFLTSLPTLNEFIAANNKHRLVANKMKRTAENGLLMELMMMEAKPITSQVHLHYHWVMKDKRKDKDNIAFAQKFVQDALVKFGVLRNDGWAEVDGFTHHFSVNKEIPCLILSIEKLPNE
jgi:Holliday junction resolvase RusA-like endonuclease